MTAKTPFAMPFPAVAIGFKPEFLDFQRGIRVGNLEENERITRILKLELESRYQQEFVTERYGRGVFWHWIGYLPRANREAKPVSNKVSFGCSKFFVSVDTEDGLFKCGLQVERGFLKPPAGWKQCRLGADWDWNRLVKQLRAGSALEKELKRLVQREGFRVFAGSWETGHLEVGKSDFPSTTRLRGVIERAPGNQWAGFQVYYPMTQEEVQSTTGIDLIQAMLATFSEVTPAMNLCMQVELKIQDGRV